MAYTAPLGNNANLNLYQDYYAPVASSGDLHFLDEVGTLYQIWTDENYVYAATSNGLDIYEVTNDMNPYGYVTYSGGFSSVWASAEKVFVGTFGAGIKFLPINSISGTELISHLLDFEYDLTSDYIRYVHGYGDNVLCATDAGVDFTKPEPMGLRSYTVVSGARKCFLASDKIYYTISGSEWSLNRVDIISCDWETPDVSYTTSGTIFAAGIKINDIFITEGTAADSISNTIFTATSSGIYVIDESTDEYIIYYKE